MIACILIPGFELRAALRKQPALALRPAALSPSAGSEPLLGPVTAEAERFGVRPGMRLGEGLATCPELVLVEQDPAAAEQAWEEILRALEDSGFAVDPAGVGCVYFETRGVERLYGGLEAALRRALAAVGTAWDPRAGAAQRRFAALAAANVARPGQILVVSDERLQDLLARPERRDRFIRKIALSARLVGGGSWRRSVTLRDATTEAARLKAALGPKLAELPAPVLELRLELVELTEHDGQQLELLPAAGGELDVRLREGLRQVRASTGSGSVNQVVEVAPWSRIPETRALFVPRDD